MELGYGAMHLPFMAHTYLLQFLKEGLLSLLPWMVQCLWRHAFQNFKHDLSRISFGSFPPLSKLLGNDQSL